MVIYDLYNTKSIDPATLHWEPHALNTKSMDPATLHWVPHALKTSLNFTLAPFIF